MISLLFTRRQLASLIGVMGALLFCLHLISASKPKPVHFKTLREFKDFALSKGLCFSKQPVPLFDNFFIADHPLSIESLQELPIVRKRDCGLTPAWRGLLWVCAIHSRYGQVDFETIGGKKRIWGKLLVAGDEELMNRIEQLLRSQ
jgi:hypothetical protein